MRFVAVILCAAIVGNLASPARALAMSTATEISKGAQISKQIDRESLLVEDPFLTNWVTGVGDNLAKYRAREDITYSFGIIDSDEINAFSLPGGFVHVDMGLLNTVSSDDELAAVMAHEIGHVERRHAVTMEEKANILGILIGVLSILSPIAYALGGYGGDLAMNKFSRQDELQADQYGLLLMSRAGYDPQSMLDFMDELRQMDETPESPTDKWMEDHPAQSDRIAHLEGYPQLDRPSADQVTAQAIHDQDEGRYSYSQARLEQALKIDPNDALAKQHLAQVEVALQNSGARPTANAQFAATYDADPAARASLGAAVQAAINITHDDLAIAREQERLGRQDSETLFTQLQSLSGGVPNLGNPKTPNNNLATAIAGLDHLVVDVNGTLDLTSDVLATAPGLIGDDEGMLRELGAPLRDNAGAASQAMMSSYPAIVAQLTTSSDELVRAIDRARGAVTGGADGIRTIRDYFVLLDQLDTTSGDIKDADMPRVRAALDKAQAAWDGIKASALQADDDVYAAQARWLSAHISLLDLTSSADRYAAYQGAMAHRFPGVATPDYDTVQRSGVTTGEIGCLAWMSYETKQPVSQLLGQEQATGEPCEDMALTRGLFTESMEISEGLLYQDYIDKPHAIAKR